MAITNLLFHLVLLPLMILLVQQSSASETASGNNNISRSNEEAFPAEGRDRSFGRFLKFSMDSEDSLNIKLKFSVPLLTVPLHSADPSKPSAPVELNVRGLLMAAGLGVSAAVVVPALTSILGPFELPSPWNGK